MTGHGTAQATRGERLGWTFAAGAVLALAIFVNAWGQATEPAAGDDASRHVLLIVDYGDGVQKHFTRLVWNERATVFSMMEGAMKHRRGIEVKYRGQGATLLVTEIDGLKGEPAGAGSRNWIYRVNGQIGQRSAGITPVKAGDTVLWSFETYR